MAAGYRQAIQNVYLILRVCHCEFDAADKYVYLNDLSDLLQLPTPAELFYDNKHRWRNTNKCN